MPNTKPTRSRVKPSVRIRQFPIARKLLSGARASGAAAGRVPAKWSWHYQILTRLRERLLRERGQALADAGQPLEPHSLDLADSATDESARNLALCEVSAAQSELYEIEEALKRIATGAYGVCEETGKPIPAARLRAVPWTRFGKKAQVRLESTGAVCRPKLGKLGSVHPRLTGNLQESELDESKQFSQSEDESMREVAAPLPETASRRITPRAGGHRGSAAASRRRIAIKQQHRKK